MRTSRAPELDPLTTMPPAAERASADEQVSLLGLVNALLRRRGVVLGLALGTAAVLSAVTLVLPREYTSHASFMPQSRRLPSGLSGVAAQFGLTMPMQEGSESPQFYVNLLRSREVLRGAVTMRYTFDTDSGPTTANLVQVYRSRGKTPALREDAAMRRLAKEMGTDISPQTGVVSLSIPSPNAQLSRQVAERLIDLVSQFNLNRRQTQAGEERRFTQQRVAEVKQDLRAAEGRLERFLQANRDFRNSPPLTFEQQRLEADVSVLREVVNTLTQALEQAKIDQVRDTPVITVVERPEAPVRPDPRGLLLRAVLGLLGGAAVGVFIVLAQEGLRRTGVERSEEYAEFAALKRATLSDVTHPWRPLARALGRRAAM
jgi:uncharacterized protein involved in exopolysaccharide biosynthesis